MKMKDYLLILCFAAIVTLSIWVCIFYRYYNDTLKELNEAKQEITDLKQFSKTELLPCPFCGSEDLKILEPNYDGEGYEIHCSNCNCYTGSGSYEEPYSKTQVIQLWNQLPGRATQTKGDLK